ncbi:MAG: MucB/RseB C-terminal domain-containing protein [Polaromonas sp.]|jgi:sigma-E factor negative regulatory protein RseB
MFYRPFIPLALFLSVLAAPELVASQVLGSTPSVAAVQDAKVLNEWLRRMHEASKNRAYIGTYVVSSGGQMQSAKIWHVCEAGQQTERIETLTGAPRSTFRHNELVVTFLPDQKLVRHEKREALNSFPEIVQSPDHHISDFYKLKLEGTERVAGVDADVAVLVSKDAMRFGYRVWTEQKKGLVVKLQTLDVDGRVLEQAAFSELLMDAPVKMEKLLQMMGRVDGLRVEQPTLVKTTASAQGWYLPSSVAGFKPISCYKRPASAGAASLAEDSMHWVFSDGLASVSLFVESYDRQRHSKESGMSMGATHTLTRHIGSYWLTAMGEVPMATLKQFAKGLERKK